MTWHIVHDMRRAHDPSFFPLFFYPPKTDKMLVVSALALLAWAAAPAAAKLDAAQVVEAIAAKAARPVNLVLAAEVRACLCVSVSACRTIQQHP